MRILDEVIKQLNIHEDQLRTLEQDEPIYISPYKFYVSSNDLFLEGPANFHLRPAGSYLYLGDNSTSEFRVYVGGEGATSDSRLVLRGGTKTHSPIRAYTDGNLYSYLSGFWLWQLANDQHICWADNGWSTILKLYEATKIAEFGGRIEGTQARFDGSGDNPSSGAGLELYYGGTTGCLLSFDRGTTTYKDLHIKAEETWCYTGSTVTLKLVSGDVYTEPLTDYSTTSTINGWGSFTIKKIYYKRVGKEVTVYFRIEGTADAVGASFTVPYASKNISNLYYCSESLRGMDAGTWEGQAGLICLSPNQITVLLYKNPGGSNFSATGDKRVMGQFKYEMA